MNAKHTVLALGLLALMGATAASANDRPERPKGEGPRHSHHERGSFTEDVTRTNADGKTFKRHTVQTETPNGVQRKTTLTNPEGKTATREVDASFDKDSKTFNKSVKGTDFNGNPWTRSTTVQGTGEGRERHDEWVGRDGKAGSRDATVKRGQDGK